MPAVIVVAFKASVLTELKLPAVKLDAEIDTSPIEDTLPTVNVEVSTVRFLLASLVKVPVILTVALLLVIALLAVNVVLPDK